MNFRVLYVNFLVNLIVIYVKSQTTGVCPVTSCYVNDTPCKIEDDCTTGYKCCALGGFQCCKIPLTPFVCTCGLSDTPCLSGTTCASGTSCCQDTTTYLHCCRPVPTTLAPTTTTTAVVQCSVSDTPCHVNADCMALNKTCIFDKINQLECCR